MTVAKEIYIKGLVQGVGFRPAIYRIAIRYNLHGKVMNNNTGVIINIEGEQKAVADFIVEKRVPAIFLESSIPDRNIQAVQKAVEARGWNVARAPEILSDALGNPGTTAGTYHGMIKHNIETAWP